MTTTRATTTAESAAVPPRLLSRLLPLNLVIFMGFMTVSLPLPVLPLYAAATMNAGAFTIGLLVGVQSLATVVTRPYAGRFADRRGPRSATLVGLLVCTLAGALYVVATRVPGGPGILFIGRAALGLGESLILTGAITWGIARVGAARAGQVMSWNGIAMYAALAAGAPVGLWVYQLFADHDRGFFALGLLSAGLPIAALMCAVPMPAVAAERGESQAAGPLLRRIWPFGLALTFLMAGYGALAAFYALQFAAQGWAGAGVGFGGFGLAVIGVRVAFGHWPDRIGGRPVALASMATALVGQSLIWIAPSPAFAIAGATLTGAGVALGFPALGVEAMRRVPAAGRGMLIALFSAFQDLAFGLTGPVAGLVMAMLGTGHRTAFALATVTTIVAIALLYLSTRRPIR